MTAKPETPDEHLTVLVPCYNEEAAVSGTVESILEVAPRLPLPLTVLMIDDASTDNTRQRMEELCERHPACRMMANAKNLGMGRSVLNAYEAVAPGSWVTVMPGDNEFLFASILNHLAVRDRYDVIIGYLGNPVIRTLTRRVASSTFTVVARVLYGFPYRYLNGMKMYRVEAVKGIPVVSSGHAFNAELLAKALLRTPNLRIGEVPFLSRGRGSGSSKAFRVSAILHAIRDVYRGYRSVARYRNDVVRRGDLMGGGEDRPATDASPADEVTSFQNP